jgi:hypothetical protein
MINAQVITRMTALQLTHGFHRVSFVVINDERGANASG